MKGLYTILLLTGSNVFMTIAWYGHLKLKDYEWSKGLGLFAIIGLSWGVAFFEYCLQVPANRIGSNETGGPYTLVQLKIIQEVISLTVFGVIAALFFKHEALKWNHYAAFGCMIIAVYLVFRK
jgi:uncharacterized protein